MTGVGCCDRLDLVDEGKKLENVDRRVVGGRVGYRAATDAETGVSRTALFCNSGIIGDVDRPG
jgi:hypothetical protein